MPSEDNSKHVSIGQVDDGTLLINEDGKKSYVRLYEMPVLPSSFSFAWPQKLLRKLPGRTFMRITTSPHLQQEDMAAVGEQTAKSAVTDEDLDVVSHANEGQLNQEIDPELLEGIRASNSVDIAVLLGIVTESEEELQSAADAVNRYTEENSVDLELCQKPVLIFKQLLASPNGSPLGTEHRVDAEAMGATIAVGPVDGKKENEQ